MKKILVLLALFPILFFAQNSISGTFSPVQDYTYSFLYRATPTGSDYIDRAQLAKDGSFKIAFDSTSTAGIYKIIYALPPEENNFDFIYNGEESIAFTFSKDKGLEFIESNENKLWASYIKSMDMVNQTISNFYAQESIDKKAYSKIIKTLGDTQKAYHESAKGMLADVFIKVNTPYIPSGYEDLSTYTKNLKRTYLKHVDFSNPLLQSSDFLIDRVLAYIFGMNISASNEVYRKDIDILMTTIGKGNPEIKTILFEMIWRRFKDMKNPELANYITDKYLLKLTKDMGYQALETQLLSYKNNAIGMKASNFDLPLNASNDLAIKSSLYDYNVTNQYLIIFWSSTCGHCLDELPKVNQMVKDKNDLTVIAIGLEDDDISWKTKIVEFPNFIHVLGLGKWDNPISNAYGIESTPSYILLDKNKTIIAKPYDVEALQKILK